MVSTAWAARSWLADAPRLRSSRMSASTTAQDEQGDQGERADRPWPIGPRAARVRATCEVRCWVAWRSSRSRIPQRSEGGPPAVFAPENG